MFSLISSVGRTGGNDPDDVRKIEIFLGNTDHLDLTKTDGPTGYFGGRLEDAIKSYQKEESLKSDGHVNPNGETIAQMQTVAQNAGPKKPTPPQPPKVARPNKPEPPDVPGAPKRKQEGENTTRAKDETDQEKLKRFLLERELRLLKDLIR